MSGNNIQNFREEINNINKSLNNIVNYADTKKGFFNNIFFPEKEKPIPMTLYNINYNSSSKDNNNNDAESIIKQCYLDEPGKIFLLPSSDESGNEDKNIYIPSFRQICDDIMDIQTIDMIEKEKVFPKGIYPTVLFRRKAPLTNLNQVLSFVRTYLKSDPYEIKKGFAPSSDKDKDNTTFSVKLNKYEDAEILFNCLKKTYDINARICYDKRELNDYKWYCVIFRMEGGGDQKLSKFIQLIDDIYKGITDTKKEFLTISIEGTCEGQIDEAQCIKKLGEVFYCAIKVPDLEQALTLCVKYNNVNDLKVNLHYLSYKIKKNEMPQVLINKKDIGENRAYRNKFNKSFKEDDIYMNEAADKLFLSRGMLNRKHKRNKIKQKE